MKKIFTLLALLASVLTISATDYTDTMIVSINDAVAAGQKATVSMSQQTNGKYEFKLTDFSMTMNGIPMNVGTIDLKDVDGTVANNVISLGTTQQITIEEGDDPNISWLGPLLGSVPVVLRAEQRGNTLYAVIDIHIPSLNIQVVFGGGGYQIPNSGFENYHTATLTSSFGSVSSQEPNAWHSFMSADGLLSWIAGYNPYVAESDSIRPDASGEHSIMIHSLNFGGIIANGTLTTGRLHASSPQAESTDNHTYLDMDSTAVDGNGDPFYTIMNGRPDSLDIWVKFKQGTPNAGHPYATVSAAITDGTYYQDPQDKKYTNVLATAKNNKIESRAFAWQHLSIPFDYIDKDVEGKAILVTISTNADAGLGSEDTLYVDDVSLVYNAGLKSVTFSGVTVDAEDSVKENTYNVNAFSDFDPHQISVKGKGTGAKSKISLSEDHKTVTITVMSGDLKHADTYIFHATGTASGIHNVSSQTEDKITDIYNLNGQEIKEMLPGQVYIVHYASGRVVKLMK